jgi:hypothetical protein
MSIKSLQRVLAKTILPFDGSSGLYVSVSPTFYSSEKLKGWAKHLFPNVEIDSDKFHCTVMYSKVCSTKTVTDTKMDYLAKVSHFEFWDGHDSDGYLVVVLQSPSLVHLHKKWKSLGAVHSFDDYTPHVTLLDKFKMTKELQKRIDELSTKEKGTILSFTNEQLENIKP